MRPRRSTHRRETHASRRWTSCGSVDTIRLIKRYERCREIVAVNARRREAHGHQRCRALLPRDTPNRLPRARGGSPVVGVDCCLDSEIIDGGARAKHGFVWINENVLRGIGVADDVGQGNARIEFLYGDATLVFYNALQPAVNVPHAGHDSTAELTVISHNELVGVFHACASSERFARTAH